MKDERYKQLMIDVGMPDSQSLFGALHQVANEVAQEYNKKAIEDRETSKDLVYLVRRLVNIIDTIDPANEFAKEAMEYLKEKNLIKK